MTMYWTERIRLVFAIAILFSLFVADAMEVSAESDTQVARVFFQQYGDREPLVHGVGAITEFNSPFRFFGDVKASAVDRAIEACETQLHDVLRANPPERPLPLVIELPAGLDKRSVVDEVTKRFGNNPLIERCTVTTSSNPGGHSSGPGIVIRVGLESSGAAHMAVTRAEIDIRNQRIVRDARGLAFDRTSKIVHALLAGLVCIAVCFVAGVLARHSATRLPQVLGLSAACFACGIIGQLVLLKTLHTFAPTADSPWVLSLGWIAALGYGTFLVPAAFTWRFVASSGRLWSTFRWTDADLLVAPSATMGACATLAVPILAVYPDATTILVVGLVAAVSLAHFCAFLMQGKLQDTALAWIAIAFLPAIWSLGLARNSMLLLGVTACVSFLLTLALRQSVAAAESNRQPESFTLHAPSEPPEAWLKIPIAEEISHAIAAQQRAMGASFQLLRGRRDLVAATMDQLVFGTRQTHPDLEFLEIAGVLGAEPLSPWIEICNRVDPETDLAQLAGRWNHVPIASLSGPSELLSSALQFSVPEKNAFSQLEDRIVHLLITKSAVLIIRQAGELDEASIRMVFRLRERFYAMDANLIVFLDHELTLDGKSFQFDGVLNALDLSDPQIKDLVAQQLRMDVATANLIVDALPSNSSQHHEPATLTDLNTLTAHLHRIGVLQASPSGTAMLPQYLSGEPIPLPREWSHSITDRLAGLSQQQHLILSAAACAGRQFCAHELARCLEMPGVTVVSELHAMLSTGLITESDNEFLYQFSTPSALGEICQWMKIRAWNAEHAASNLQRELHYRMFQESKRLMPEAANVNLLARHATGGGARTASEAVALNMEAARQALQSYSFSLAETHVRAAALCATRCDIDYDVERHLLSIRLEKSHVTQTELLETAASAWAYTKDCRDAFFLLQVARCCYDSSKITIGKESTQLKLRLRGIRAASRG